MLDKARGIGEIKGTTDALDYLYFFLQGMGINPPKNAGFGFKVYGAVLYFIITIVAPITFTMSLVVSNDLPMSQMLMTLQAVFNVFGIPMKAITMAIYMPNLREAGKYMCQLDMHCTKQSELKFLRHLSMTANRIVVFFCSAYFAYGFSNFVISFGSGHPLYALHLFVIDWQNSRAEFYCQAIVEFIVVGVCIFFQVAQDCYGAVYIYIMRIHIRMLAARIEVLGKSTQNVENAQKEKSELVQCIADHRCLLDLLDTISPIISVTMFIQFVVAAATMGVTMINIVLFADTAEKIASMVYLFAVMVQTVPTCYHATLLIDESLLLPDAIFHCNWMYQDLSYRKLILIFMQRTQQPMSLLAMKLFPITLDTNWSIAKFSFSLYTLLKEMEIGTN